MHPIDRAWIDSNVAHIEQLAGTLPADVRQYTEDKLTALLAEVCSLTVDDGDVELKAAIRNASKGLFTDAPASSEALNRAAYQFSELADRGIDPRYGV